MQNQSIVFEKNFPPLPQKGDAVNEPSLSVTDIDKDNAIAVCTLLLAKFASDISDNGVIRAKRLSANCSMQQKLNDQNRQLGDYSVPHLIDDVHKNTHMDVFFRNLMTMLFASPDNPHRKQIEAAMHTEVVTHPNQWLVDDHETRNQRMEDQRQTLQEKITHLQQNASGEEASVNMEMNSVMDTTNIVSALLRTLKDLVNKANLRKQGQN